MESRVVGRSDPSAFKLMFEPGSSEYGRVLQNDAGPLQEAVYTNNSWVNEKLVKFGYVDGWISFKVFFMIERLTFPQNWEEAEKKRVRRDWAKHPEFADAEYFPVVLAKFNIRNAANEAASDNDLRVIVPVRNLNETFQIHDQDRYGEPITKHHKESDVYLVSRRLYEVRDWLTVSPTFINHWLTADIDQRAIFQEVKSRFLYYADIPECWASMLALWTMGTHIFQIFPAYPYINLWAEHGSGKSRVLKVAASLAHMGKHVEDPSAASAFRLVDAVNATLCVDEADKLTPDQGAELLGILNTGYESGASIPRYNVDKKMLEEFNAFSPKMLASNRALGVSLESRCLRIPIMRSANPKDFANRDPKGELDSGVLEELRNELILWAIDQGSAIYELDREAVSQKYQSQFADAPPRLFQVMTPLLCLYEHLGLDEDCGAFKSEKENLAQVIGYLSEEKKAASIPEPDQRILIALANVAEGLDRITMKEIHREILGPDPSEEEKKFYNASKVGIILRKYAIPRRSVDGRAQYFPGKSVDARRAAMDDLLKRFNVERSALDKALSDTSDQDRNLDRYGDRDEPQ